jgi:hypothetical protein
MPVGHPVKTRHSAKRQAKNRADAAKTKKILFLIVKTPYELPNRFIIKYMWILRNTQRLLCGTAAKFVKNT